MILLIVIRIMGSIRQQWMEMDVIREKEILAVGIAAGMNKEKCLDIMKGIEANVKERLGEYL